MCFLIHDCRNFLCMKSYSCRSDSVIREIPRTEMAESAVPKGILVVIDSWRRYAESTFRFLRIGHCQSYAGNLQVDFRADLRANSMGLTLTKTPRFCFFSNKLIISHHTLKHIHISIHILHQVHHILCTTHLGQLQSITLSSLTICGFIVFCN